MTADINYAVAATVDSDTLNKIWVKWCQHKNKQWFSFDYSRVSRKGIDAQQFEKWLYRLGGTIARSNKQCYIQFVDAEQALIFRLKYG